MTLLNVSFWADEQAWQISARLYAQLVEQLAPHDVEIVSDCRAFRAGRGERTAGVPPIPISRPSTTFAPGSTLPPGAGTAGHTGSAPAQPVSAPPRRAAVPFSEK